MMPDFDLTELRESTLLPLLRKVATLEKADHSLRRELQDIELNREFRTDISQDELNRARAEVSRLEKLIETFCKETLSAMNARDGAMSALGQAKDEAAHLEEQLKTLKNECDTLQKTVEDMKSAELKKSDASARSAQYEIELQMELERSRQEGEELKSRLTREVDEQMALKANAERHEAESLRLLEQSLIELKHQRLENIRLREHQARLPNPNLGDAAK